MRYNVSVTVFAPISTVLEIEANDEYQAANKAVDVVLSDSQYRVKDFDGNTVEILGDDVIINGVDTPQ